MSTRDSTAPSTTTSAGCAASSVSSATRSPPSGASATASSPSRLIDTGIPTYHQAMAVLQPGWLGEATPLITFVSLGLPAGAIGVAWPPMRSAFAAPLAGLGLLLAAITIAYFVGSASYG